MTVADYVVRYLAEHGVKHVFTLSGGMICPMLDAAARYGQPVLVPMAHEQGAGFAAEGWARMTGVPGVAMATSGPGATNLLTAIGSCYFDSTPAVFITGQVRRDELRGPRWDGPGFYGRQLGFQELDICAMAAPITKAATVLKGGHAQYRIRQELDFAFRLATAGRPGPVLIDIPFDVQRDEAGGLDDAGSFGSWAFPPEGAFNAAEVESALAALREAKRPLVLVGGGARCPSLLPFLDRRGAPVVNSLLGTDVLPYDHPLRVGMIGTYGARHANWAAMNCDALLVLGSRLDVRQTGADVASFAKRTIVHVDIDPRETRVPAIRVRARVEDFCKADESSCAMDEAPLDWRNAIIEKDRAWGGFSSRAATPAINPHAFLYELSRASTQAAAFVVDVGQHQMWAAKFLALQAHQRFLTSGGMGAMGFALPASIGAHYATNKPVVCIAGDGGFQVNLQELEVIASRRLPIKMVVLNNAGHGMVRQFQDEVFEKRHVGTDLAAPAFSEIARAYGIPSRRIWSHGGASATRFWIDGALVRLWEDSEPFLLEVEIPPEVHALPKTRFGRALDDME